MYGASKVTMKVTIKITTTKSYNKSYNKNYNKSYNKVQSSTTKCDHVINSLVYVNNNRDMF